MHSDERVYYQNKPIEPVKTSVAVLAMAILQSYSPYHGEQALLETADSGVLTNIRKGLYRNGYLMWDAATITYKLTSLGEDVLKAAMADPQGVKR